MSLCEILCLCVCVCVCLRVSLSVSLYLCVCVCVCLHYVALALQLLPLLPTVLISSAHSSSSPMLCYSKLYVMHAMPPHPVFLRVLVWVSSDECAAQAAVEWRKDMYAKCDSRIGKLTRDPSTGGGWCPSEVQLQWVDDGSESGNIKAAELTRLTAAEILV